MSGDQVPAGNLQAQGGQGWRGGAEGRSRGAETEGQLPRALLTFDAGSPQRLPVLRPWGITHLDTPAAPECPRALGTVPKGPEGHYQPH